MTMTNTYLAAQAKSYEGQKDSFSIKTRAGDSIEIPLGFQPLGISINDGVIAVAAYFEPAIMLADIEVLPDALNFRNIRWIRGTIHDGLSVRMFPDMFQPGGANRMQSVAVHSKDHLWYTRNGDRRIYSISLHADGKWYHEDEVIVPEGQYPMLHSILTDEDRLLTTESDDKLEKWSLCTYLVSAQGRARLGSCRPITTYRYLGAHHADGKLYSVGDVRAGKHSGIFVDGKKLRLVDDVAGNGICLLDGGRSGALITRYGQAYTGPFNGIPGALIYVPPRLL